MRHSAAREVPAMRRAALGVAGSALLLPLGGCIFEDVDFSKCPPQVIRLVVDYEREWQYTQPGATDWRLAWDSLGMEWSYDALRPPVPEGLRTVLYDMEGDEAEQRNIPASGGNVYLYEEWGSLLLYNNDTEYYVFDDIHEIEDANVRTRIVSRPGYEGSEYAPDADLTVSAPDVLYHAYVPEVEYVSVRDTVELHVKMAPIVYSYVVRYGFRHGLNYVAKARGALAGVAYGALLDDGNRLSKRVSVVFDADIYPAKDCALAVVHSFGSESAGGFAGYGLNLELRLKNGKILHMDFDVSEQMRRQPEGGVLLVDGIDIPDDVGKEDTGTFDVSVEGWGEFEDIPVEM